MTDTIQFRWHMRTNRLGVIRAGMQDRADAIVAKTAMDIAAKAQGRAPVDTGTLRASIQATGGGSRWRVVVGADYGVYVEYGTRFMAAQPYFTPSVAEARPAFLAAMRQVIV